MEAARDLAMRKMAIETDIAAALGAGLEWVEVDADMMPKLFPQGLGSQKYGMYKNVKVCPHGMSEAIQKDLDTPIGIRWFPTDAKVEGNPS